MIRHATLAIALTLLTGMAHAAGMIEQACNRSDRGAANPRICNCIQQIADQSLTRADQKLAAGFFADPHQAQVIRQSDDRRHEAFWQRYKRFTAYSQTYCASIPRGS